MNVKSLNLLCITNEKRSVHNTITDVGRLFSGGKMHLAIRQRLRSYIRRINQCIVRLQLHAVKLGIY